MLAILALSLSLTPIVTGLDRPVQVVSANDHSGRLYVAQQRGTILVLPSRSTFLDISNLVDCCENGGLLSVVFHPNYAINGQLFVLYVNKNGDTVLARYRGATGEILFVVPQPKDNVPNHHGGTLVFGSDGYLYVSIGDGGAFVKVTNRAQELDHLLGKLLRIDVDRGTPYAVPPDNPFVGVAGVRPEIWSYGLRNPWRFSFDRLTGELLMGDVGQDSWEEIDIATLAQARGANFGWPRMEASHCFPPGSTCSTAGLTLPALEYPRDLGCSVTGGFRYRGSLWPSLYGTYFYGDFCTGRIWGDSQVLADTEMNIVSFGEDDEGELYVVDYRGTVFQVGVPTVRRRAR
jgi:glucose/arabinose dehydrogenase